MFNGTAQRLKVDIVVNVEGRSQHTVDLLIDLGETSISFLDLGLHRRDMCSLRFPLETLPLRIRGPRRLRLRTFRGLTSLLGSAQRRVVFPDCRLLHSLLLPLRDPHLVLGFRDYASPSHPSHPSLLPLAASVCEWQTLLEPPRVSCRLWSVPGSV